MKKIISAAFLMLLAFGAMAFIGVLPKIKFITADWEAAQTRAKAEKKLYFVDFDASYCASCRNMDASTYQDPALATYMEGNVVALRLDVQDFEGIMWSQKYEVEALPTMLIFNEEGKLVKRLVGYKSAKDLIAAFQEASVVTAHKTAATAKPATPAAATKPAAAPVVTAKPAPVTKPAATIPARMVAAPVVKPAVIVTKPTATATKSVSPQPISEDNKPVLKPVTSSRPKTASAPVKTEMERGTAAPSGKGLYELNIRRAMSSGYSVQLGVYSSYDLLLDQADKIASKFSGQKVLVHVDEIGGQLVYKLLIGNFSDKRDAGEFRETLRKSGFDGIVKDLSVMK